MKVLVLALAVLATLAPAAVLASPSVQYDLPAAFEFACSVLQYDCTDVPLPRVEIVGDLLFAYGALGAYSGGDVVYIDGALGPFLQYDYMQSILAHELTHYLDTQLGYVDLNDMTQRCLTEANGWRVGNAYVVSVGRPEFADFTWNIRYGCFQ